MNSNLILILISNFLLSKIKSGIIDGTNPINKTHDDAFMLNANQKIKENNF